MKKTVETLPGEFVIHVDELQKGSIKIDRDIPMEWLTEALGQCEYPVIPRAGFIRATVQSVSPGVLVRGAVIVSAQTECGTCLSTVDLDLNPELDAFLMPVSQKPEGNEEEELTPEDLAREWYDGNEIDLSDLIRDNILLELPMNPRCHGPCQKIDGLVTAEEAEQKEKAVDPRLAVLAERIPSKEK